MHFFARDLTNFDSRVSFTTTFDGAPLSDNFDAGVVGANNGWFFPGADGLVVPAGTHVVVVNVTARFAVRNCPACPRVEQVGATTLTLDLVQDEHRLVLIRSIGPGQAALGVSAWSVDDNPTRAGAAGLRLVGSEGPAPPGATPRDDSVDTTVAFDGCARVPARNTPAPLLSVLHVVPADDDGEAWFGLRTVSPRAEPQPMFWTRLLDREPGRVSTVLLGSVNATPPQTEGEPLTLTSSGTAPMPDCPRGPE